MSITIYGVILMAYILLVFIRTKNNKKRFIKLFTLSIFLYTNITIGYVIKVGDQTIAGYFLAMLFSAVASVHFLLKLKPKDFINLAVIIVILITGIVLIPVMNYQVIDNNGWDWYLFGANNIITNSISNKNIKELIKAVSFVIIAVASNKILTRSDWVCILNSIVQMTKYTIIFGVVEFIVVYIFKIYNLYSIFLQPLFGLKESTYAESMARGSFHQLQGLFTEPSAYATGLFVAVLALVTQNKINKINNIKTYTNNNKWIAVCLFLMMFSMSFSSILYLTSIVICMIVYIYVNNKNFRSIIILSSGILIGVITVMLSILANSNTYYGERLSAAFSIISVAFTTKDLNNLWFHVANTVGDGSSVSRLGSAIGIIRIEFIQNPLIGLGVGTANSYALLPNMLTDIGIIGTIIWVRLIMITSEIRHGRYFKMIAILVMGLCCIIVPFQCFGTDSLYILFLLGVLFGKGGIKEGENIKLN